MFMSDYDYKEKPKKKKKHHHQNDREDDSSVGLKAKPVRNFKIIDDDIDINTLNPSEDVEALVDMLDPEGPQIAEMDEYEKLKLLQKSEQKSNENQNKWVKLDMFDDENDNEEKKQNPQENSSSLFRKRTTEKSGNKQLNSDDFKTLNQNNANDDDDLDMIPRKRRDSDDLDVPRRKTKNDSDGDLSPVRRRNKHSENDDLSPVRRKPQERSREKDLSPVRRKTRKDDENDLSPQRPNKREKSREKDLSPVRRKNKEEVDVDETKVRVRKMTKEEEIKKARKEEKMAKYMEWGKGLVQKKERDEKLAFDVYEAEKPLARYKDDKDLERLLKEQEREEDPMLEYIRSSKSGDILEDGSTKSKPPKPKYQGPPPPPNRYNILPGPRWDGVDRSNGFEKKYYESITARKAKEEEAYKWSTEDM